MTNTRQRPGVDAQRRMIEIARAVRIDELYRLYLEMYPTGNYATEALLFLGNGIRIFELSPMARKSPSIPIGHKAGQFPIEVADLSALANQLEFSSARCFEERAGTGATRSTSFMLRWARDIICRCRVVICRTAWTCFQY